MRVTQRYVNDLLTKCEYWAGMVDRAKTPSELDYAMGEHARFAKWITGLLSKGSVVPTKWQPTDTHVYHMVYRMYSPSYKGATVTMYVKARNRKEARASVETNLTVIWGELSLTVGELYSIRLVKLKNPVRASSLYAAKVLWHSDSEETTGEPMNVQDQPTIASTLPFFAG